MAFNNILIDSHVRMQMYIAVTWTDRLFLYGSYKHRTTFFFENTYSIRCITRRDRLIGDKKNLGDEYLVIHIQHILYSMQQFCSCIAIHGDEPHLWPYIGEYLLML